YIAASRTCAHHLEFIGMQYAPEATTSSVFVVELDASADSDSELARDRQAEASAVRVLRDEGMEDAVSVLSSDPRPRVGDLHLEASVPCVEGELDRAAVRRPFERVREQVRDHLQDAVPVGDDHRFLAVGLEAVVDVALARL